MNVLHVIPGIASRYGGPSQAIRWMCASLATRPDMNIVLATTDADGAGGKLNVSEVPTSFPVHIFPRTWSERWKYSGQLANWLNLHVSEFDLIHIHALWSHAPYAAARAARQAGVPYLIRPAGMLSRYSLNRRATLKQVSWWLAERNMVAEATAFHATSEAESEDIRSVWPAANTFVIPNGVDDAAFTTPPDPKSVRQKLFEGSTDRPLVLFLSRLHPKKGVIDILLPAIAAMSPRPLLLLAGGTDDHDPGYADLVEQTIDTLDLREDVCLWGAVKGDDRWSLFDAADVFVLPSHSENFGIVVAEAMARGCPSIITDGVQIVTHVQLSNAGLVVSPEPKSLAAALDHLLQNPTKRNEMSVAGKQYAREHFSWLAIATKIGEVYGHWMSS